MNLNRTAPPLYVPWLVAFIMVSLLGVSIVACQPVASADMPPPHLVGVISVPAQWGYPSEVLVHPNGLAYVVLQTGGVAVLDGPDLVTVIPRPDLGQYMGFMDAALAAHPDTGLVYWTDHQGYVHVISGTQVITSIAGVEHILHAITIHPDTGLIYVANAIRRGWPENQTLPSNVTVISGTQIVTDLIVGYVPTQLEFNPVDRRIYVAQNIGTTYLDQELLGMLGIIDGLAVITNTSLGVAQELDAISDIAVNPNDGSLYLNWGGPILYWDREHPPLLYQSCTGMVGLVI